MFIYLFQDTAAPVDSNNEVCLVCNKSKNHGELKLFTEQTWGSFKRASESRLAMQTDRYRDLTMEINLQDEPGNAKYHSTCYRYYTAVKRKSSDPPNAESSAKAPDTRRRSSLPSTDHKGLLKGSCIFCTVLRKTVNGKE